MNNIFRVASATIPGRAHVGRGSLLLGRNNQDAVKWTAQSDLLVAIVCDGCGSGERSEVGALLGADFLVGALIRRGRVMMAAPISLEEQRRWLGDHLERLKSELLRFLRLLSENSADSREEFIRDSLLFTILGIVVTPTFTTIFSFGDGVYALNEKIRRIGPFPGNAPPYLGALLFDSGWKRSEVPGQHFTIEVMAPTSQVDSLMIGTDGVLDLLKASGEGRRVPGKTQQLLSPAHFWSEDRFFRNPDSLRRYLALINSRAQRLDSTSGQVRYEGGLLDDDTTLVLIRRARSGAEGWAP